MPIARAVATRSPIIIFDDSTSALDAQTEAEVMRAIGVSVDGHDISSFDREQLRRKLGIVLQDTQLFMGTIKGNMLYGRQDATDEEIVAAAKMANAYHVIMGLPDKYETVVSSNGDSISRGQRQLLAIARIMLIDP